MPFGCIFALGALLAALLRRPFQMVCGLAAIAAFMNAGILLFFWSAGAAYWEKAIPLTGIMAAACGVLIAAAVGRERR